MTGRLTIKNGKYYVIVSYKDVTGKYKNKWYSTGLDEKNNKRQAKAFMDELMSDLRNQSTQTTGDIRSKMLFADYILQWFDISKPQWQESTIGSYQFIVNAIDSYFRPLKITLEQLRGVDLQQYYSWLASEGKSQHVILHHHRVLHRALQAAYKLDLIINNPADKVDRPKTQKYHAEFFTLEQTISFLEKIKDDYLSPFYALTIIHGFRRSELIGLKWDAIDFSANTLIVRHTVIETSKNGKKIEVEKNLTKNDSSFRTYPLVPKAKTILLQLKKQQEQNKIFFQGLYKNTGYVCQDEFGQRYKVGRISSHFKLLLQRNNFKEIRFHDLRHTCASILLAYGVGLKFIQEWLGHSTYNTTADIYAHLVFSDKLTVSDAFEKMFSGSRDFVNTDMGIIHQAVDKLFEAEASETVSQINDNKSVVEQELKIDKDNEIQEQYKKLGFENLSEYINYLIQIQKQKDDFEME